VQEHPGVTTVRSALVAAGAVGHPHPIRTLADVHLDELVAVTGGTPATVAEDKR
jgi:hypothetical protein